MHIKNRNEFLLDFDQVAMMEKKKDKITLLIKGWKDSIVLEFDTDIQSNDAFEEIVRNLKVGTAMVQIEADIKKK